MSLPDLTKRSNIIWLIAIVDAVMFVTLLACYLWPRLSGATAEVKGVFEGYNGALFLALNIGRETSAVPDDPKAKPTNSVPVNGA